MRSVLVVTLHPVHACPPEQWGHGQAPTPAATTTVRSVPPETDTTLTFTTTATPASTAAKREAAFVAAYRRWRGPDSAALTRYPIRPAGHCSTRDTDVYQPSRAVRGQRHDDP